MSWYARLQNKLVPKELDIANVSKSQNLIQIIENNYELISAYDDDDGDDDDYNDDGGGDYDDDDNDDDCDDCEI
jgi:hypothetical protein